ncbi:MAG TPA: GNAT family N-acetyltransferase [Pyrinomonadaceae bacterium]|nr:GNAT family N-acetyltransferase [Pyrinomonadaceae bacterium]
MLETQRLLLRKFTPDDLETLIELRSDDEVAWGIGGARAQAREFNKQRLEFAIDCYEKFGFGMCAMIWKETGEFFGWSGLQPLQETGEIEVGYGMAKRFWRQGIGFECARAWLEFGFNKIGLERIVAVALPENKASWRIMEKLGMRYEKTETHYGMECVFYAISRAEFQKETK